MPLYDARFSESELAEIVAFYRTAAEVCAEVGFDGIEPHGAHGYLLNQFFSPVIPCHITSVNEDILIFRKPLPPLFQARRVLLERLG